MRPLNVGAVLYDPKVSVIWEIIGDFFEAQRAPIDLTFFTNYELQVDALAGGTIDIAWNSPLAWLDSVRRTGGACRAIAMRDTDRDRVSHIVARRGGPVSAIGDLRGRTLATGAVDSPQATLIPLGLVRRRRRDSASCRGRDTPRPCRRRQAGLRLEMRRSAGPST
jgi:ABC-type phosphate/phosphonate transport system substrate-binding protein